MTQRQIDEYLWDPEIIGRKMIFLSGPRQVGKTTYAREVVARHNGRYFNWDVPETRRAYRSDTFFFLLPTPVPPLVAFDEIHNQKNWKNILKGMYDGLDTPVRLVVTGSARLEWFRKSGDSLIGRYSHFHLYPFSVSEVVGNPFGNCWLCQDKDHQSTIESLWDRVEGIEPSVSGSDAVQTLLQYGGFPEPFTSASPRFVAKWNRDYLSLLLQEDLRELTNIRDLDRMERLALLLPSHIGVPLSVNALARELETSFPTAKASIGQLERLWLVFSIRPYSRSINRSVKKEVKTYFVNWTFVEDEGIRFENFLAVQLQRACHIWSDTGYADAGLRYLRNFDGTEIDFLLTIKNRPVVCIEAKLSDDWIGEPQINLARSVGVPIIQVVRRSGIFRRISDTATVISADRFLQALP